MMRLSSTDSTPHQEDANGGGAAHNRCFNSQLWHACAGPLVSLPVVATRVVYFPQGHSEQVSNSTNKEVDSQMPNYQDLPPQLICQLHDLTMHADSETDEVYAQMTLQPLNQQDQKEMYLPAELGIPCKQPMNYFCKTLTASDTSTHGGFSVPRRAAEKVFPPLDFSQQPPAQELVARDLHDNEWKFRHIFRGQPKRHLLTTGWSIFVSAKRLVAGDSVLFIWNEKNQLFIGIRRSNRPQPVLPSSVLSSDSMHLGLLAAAAHASSTKSRFTIFYNPRASPSEFVIPFAKYVKAVYHTRVSIGMRFRMLVETEESNVRRHMGTITGIGDLDPSRWSNSHWRSVKVGWDESSAGERQTRVSLWDIEPLTTFPMYQSPFSFGLKRPWPSGISDSLGMSRLSWFQGHSMQHGMQMHPLSLQGVGAATPYMLGMPTDIYQVMAAAALQDMRSTNPPRQASLPHLPFHQPQGIPTSTSFLQAPVLPSSQPQRSFLQHAEAGQAQLQTEAASGMLQHHMVDHQQAPNLVSSMPQFSSMPQTVTPYTEDAPSDHVNVTRNDDSLVSSAAWLHKRTRVEPPQRVLPQVELVNSSLPSNSEDTFLLPPFPGRDCSFEADEATGVHNSLMFGANMGDNGNLPFSLSNVMTADYTIQSVCANGSALVCPPADTGDEPPEKNFVKVHKSDSCGRSLNLAKFSSYHELRSELGRMFGLEGQLEDPRRSGWQLVFVDKENDVLLLGDDPWMEFVNSVWCIKILSLQEMQQMDQQGMELLGSVPFQKLSNSAFEDPREMNLGIPCMGTLEYQLL